MTETWTPEAIADYIVASEADRAANVIPENARKRVHAAYVAHYAGARAGVLAAVREAMGDAPVAGDDPRLREADKAGRLVLRYA